MIPKENSNIIRKRRSVFPAEFNGNTIDKETILEILKNANTAPTHKLTQPWLFKVFSGKSKINLGDKLISINLNLYNENKKKKIIQKFKVSSHIICICMRRDINKLIPEWEEVAATAMAVQNIWLSCVNSNIGGYWSTPKGIDKLNTYLNLSKYEKCLGLFFLGKYDTLKQRILPRKNIEKDITWFE